MKLATATPAKTINDWELDPKGSSFTADELLDAYFIGKKVGMNAKEKEITERIQRNMNLATAIGGELYETISKDKINCRESFLKIQDSRTFQVLFFIENSQYTEDNLKKLYSYARAKKKLVNTEDFFLDISFMFYDNALNIERLNSDGYSLRYNKAIA